MLIYTVVLGAIVVIAYLIQFQLYRHSSHNALETDLKDLIYSPAAVALLAE